jgi:hypothetical protein
VAGVGGLELANVGFLKSQPNSLVSWKIFVPETFRGGCEEGGYAIDPGAEPGIGRAILIGAALPSRKSAKLKCRSPAGRALGQAILIYLAIASSPVTAQDAQPGRATFAEMVAFARVGSVACQRLAPDVEGFHALALQRLIKPPLTDKEIVAKEKEVKRRRDRLGLSRWCRLYAGEMEQARILVEVLRRQN